MNTYLIIDAFDKKQLYPFMPVQANSKKEALDKWKDLVGYRINIEAVEIKRS